MLWFWACEVLLQVLLHHLCDFFRDFSGRFGCDYHCGWYRDCPCDRDYERDRVGWSRALLLRVYVMISNECPSARLEDCVGLSSVRMCMYVCMYVYMYVCMYVRGWRAVLA